MTVSLVTGGAGFIGSHVVDHLLKMGHEVVILDDLSGGDPRNVPEGSTLVARSITDHYLVDELFNKHHFDHVFHLAAYAAEGLSHFIRRYNYETNVIGSVVLINAAIKYGVKRFVFASSAAVYGYNARRGADEQQLPTPADPYGIAKYTVEMDLIAAAMTFDLHFTIFRLHNVYGPRQSLHDGYRNVIGIFMRQCLQNQSMTIFGNGSQTRQFTFIDDVAPYIARSAEVDAAANHIINAGHSAEYSVNYLASMVAEAFGVEEDIEYFPERHEAGSVFVHHDKFKRIFGSPNSTRIYEGLVAMAAWAKTQTLHEPKPFAAIEIDKNLPEAWRKLHEH